MPARGSSQNGVLASPGQAVGPGPIPVQRLLYSHDLDASGFHDSLRAGRRPRHQGPAFLRGCPRLLESITASRHFHKHATLERGRAFQRNILQGRELDGDSARRTEAGQFQMHRVRTGIVLFPANGLDMAAGRSHFVCSQDRQDSHVASTRGRLKHENTAFQPARALKLHFGPGCFLFESAAVEDPWPRASLGGTGHSDPAGN